MMTNNYSEAKRSDSLSTALSSSTTPSSLAPPSHLENIGELKKLSDFELLDQTARLVRTETQTTTAILHHLKEIDDRKLYAEKNCDSLFTYCIRILRYSESQAHRRITAARLLREIPDLDRKIEDGRLTLTNIAQAHSFFLYENRSGRPVTVERKTEILSHLEEKSTREAERILIAEHPEERPLNRESVRYITDNAIELKLIVDTGLMQKLTRVKVLAGHKLPHGTWADVIGMMCDEVLERRDPLEKAKRAARHEAKKSEKVFPDGRATNASPNANTSPSSVTNNLNEGDSRFRPSREPIPAQTRHRVWLRDLGRCAHLNAQGARCGSTLRIEIDHIRPIWAGGGNEFSNLRLLCRAHNQRRNVAMEWGETKIEPP